MTMRLTGLVLCGTLAAAPGVALLRAQALDPRGVLRGLGVDVPRSGAQQAFDEGIVVAGPIPPSAFAGLLANMGVFGGRDRVEAAYAFGVVAGRGAAAVLPGDMAMVGGALVQMMATPNTMVRVAGARVAGRVFATQPGGTPGPIKPAGLIPALFDVLNQPGDAEQRAAIDALGRLHERTAVQALVEHFGPYHRSGKRALAAAALAALARIGDPAGVPLLHSLSGERWHEREDAPGLAVAFARERYLKDGSVARIQRALTRRALRPQALEYLQELGVQVP